MAHYGPWEEHRENVLYRLEKHDRDLDVREDGSLANRVKQIEDDDLRGARRGAFWGAAVGAIVMLIPFLGFVLAMMRYMTKGAP